MIAAQSSLGKEFYCRPDQGKFQSGLFCVKLDPQSGPTTWASLNWVLLLILEGHSAHTDTTKNRNPPLAFICKFLPSLLDGAKHTPKGTSAGQLLWLLLGTVRQQSTQQIPGGTEAPWSMKDKGAMQCHPSVCHWETLTEGCSSECQLVGLAAKLARACTIQALSALID